MGMFSHVEVQAFWMTILCGHKAPKPYKVVSNHTCFPESEDIASYCVLTWRGRKRQGSPHLPRSQKTRTITEPQDAHMDATFGCYHQFAHKGKGHFRFAWYNMILMLRNLEQFKNSGSRSPLSTHIFIACVLSGSHVFLETFLVCWISPQNPQKSSKKSRSSWNSNIQTSSPFRKLTQKIKQRSLCWGWGVPRSPLISPWLPWHQQGPPVQKKDLEIERWHLRWSNGNPRWYNSQT